MTGRSENSLAYSIHDKPAICHELIIAFNEKPTTRNQQCIYASIHSFFVSMSKESKNKWLTLLLPILVVFSFSHVVPVLAASYVINAYKESEKYPIILFQTLGSYFIVSAIALVFQQYMTKALVGIMWNKFEEKESVLFLPEHAFIFLLGFFPITCVLIIIGMNPYWTLPLIYFVWEFILMIYICKNH